MAEASITFNAEQLVGKLNALTKVQIPRAGRLALNTALFEYAITFAVRSFKRFSICCSIHAQQLSYEKAEQVGDDLHARVFGRDDAPKGNAPTRYLNPHIRGGRAYETRFQKSLTNTIVQQIDGRAVADLVEQCCGQHAVLLSSLTPVRQVPHIPPCRRGSTTAS